MFCIFFFFLVFYVRFLSIKELTLLVFWCSMFGFSDKRATFISLGCSLFVFHIKEFNLLVLGLLCVFFHIKELPLFSKIRKKHGGLPYL